MDGDRGSSGALRRRERHLRAWQGHVLAAVQLAHKVEPRNAPRGQEKRAGRGPETHFGSRHRRPYLRGCGRHLCLRCPGSMRCDRTVHGTSLGAPSLALPQLAADETLDSTALSYLLSRTLEQKRMKEEEEKRKKEEEQQRILFSLRAWKPPRQFAGRLLLLPCAEGRGFTERRGRVRPCSVGWLPVRLVGGLLRRRRVRDVLGPDGS